MIHDRPSANLQFHRHIQNFFFKLIYGTGELIICENNFDYFGVFGFTFGNSTMMLRVIKIRIEQNNNSYVNLCLLLARAKGLSELLPSLDDRQLSHFEKIAHWTNLNVILPGWAFPKLCLVSLPYVHYGCFASNWLKNWKSLNFFFFRTNGRKETQLSSNSPWAVPITNLCPLAL